MNLANRTPENQGDPREKLALQQRVYRLCCRLSGIEIIVYSDRGISTIDLVGIEPILQRLADTLGGIQERVLPPRSTAHVRALSVKAMDSFERLSEMDGVPPSMESLFIKNKVRYLLASRQYRHHNHAEGCVD